MSLTSPRSQFAVEDNLECAPAPLLQVPRMSPGRGYLPRSGTPRRSSDATSARPRGAMG
jgi:hypothetical protein